MQLREPIEPAQFVYKIEFDNKTTIGEFPMNQKMKIRVAKVEDAQALLSIYAPYVRTTAITFEYEVPSKDEFAKRIQHILQSYPYLVAELNGEAMGYAYAGAFNERAAYGWAVETTIYVKRNKRRLGIGRKLYDALETALKAQGILNLNACIAYPKEEDEYLTKDSIFFHNKMGFQMVGQFHNCGYKFNRWYNMEWMEKQIGSHEKKQSPVKPFADINSVLMEG